MNAALYDFEPARWCNGCHRVVVMPERHDCQNPLVVPVEGEVA